MWFASGSAGVALQVDSRRHAGLIDGHRMAPYPSATTVSDRRRRREHPVRFGRANRSAEGWRLGRLWIRRDRGRGQHHLEAILRRQDIDR